jgi:hypothetical protein
LVHVRVQPGKLFKHYFFGLILLLLNYYLDYGLTNYIDTKAKCCHLKISTFKGTLRQLFSCLSEFIDWRGDTVILVVPTQLCEVLLLSPFLWFNSPPFPVWIVYMYKVCKRGVGILGLRQINTCRKIPLQVNILDDDILHCLLWVLSFYHIDSFNGRSLLVSGPTMDPDPDQDQDLQYYKDRGQLSRER